MKKFEIINFPKFEDDRGETIPFEFDKKFPFEVKRTYLVTSKNNQIRGGHAHLIEDEVFVAAQGSIKAIINDGSGDQEIILNQKNKALVIRNYCWHEFLEFSDNAVLLCFSSTHYLSGEKNYIMDKEKFLEKLVNFQ
jgi:dTDP-4-dehydrorhamnose 3,5-epimerase-like enzyme